MKKIYLMLLMSLLKMAFSQQIEIKYNFIENYPLFPNPPIKESFLYIDNDKSLFMIMDTLDLSKNKLLDADESSSEIKTWNLKKYKDNRMYFIHEDSLNSKLRLKDQYFVINESIPKIDWKITSDSKLILGYNCQAAETTFRGYEYKVYFTNEIPVSRGPWIFNGLPGVILYAENEEKSVIMEATMIKLNLDKSSILEESEKKLQKYNFLTRLEYVSRYVQNLENERKFAKSKGSTDFTNTLKEKGIKISNVENSYEKMPPPTNIEIRGFILSN